MPWLGCPPTGTKVVFMRLSKNPDETVAASCSSRQALDNNQFRGFDKQSLSRNGRSKSGGVNKSSVPGQAASLPDRFTF
jgi:hypothetical protein